MLSPRYLAGDLLTLHRLRTWTSAHTRTHRLCDMYTLTRLPTHGAAAAHDGHVGGARTVRQGRMTSTRPSWERQMSATGSDRRQSGTMTFRCSMRVSLYIVPSSNSGQDPLESGQASTFNRNRPNLGRVRLTSAAICPPHTFARIQPMFDEYIDRVRLGLPRIDRLVRAGGPPDPLGPP